MKLLGFPIKRIMMLLVVLLILLTVASDTAQAISSFNDNDVDSESNVDSASNVGNTPIMVEQSVIGGASSSTTVVSASIAGVTNHLYIAVISVKNYQGTSSVSGLGLTWTEIADQCGGRLQAGVSVWWAQGTASSGTVTGTMASSVPNVVIQVHRISGTATSSPIGASGSANTNGISGSCSGGTDTTDPSVVVSSTTDQAMIFGAVAVRSRSLTPGNGFTSLTENYFGTGGDTAGGSTEYQIINPGQSTEVNGTLSSTSDWAIVAFEIKPVPPSSYADAQAQDSTNQELREANTNPASHQGDTIDIDSSDVDSAGSIGTLNNFGNIQTKDSSYATFNEELGDDYSADLTNVRFQVGSGGTTDFGSSRGTIEMWIKLDDTSTLNWQRPWGQNDNFETRIEESEDRLWFDFGRDNVLASGTQFNIPNKWYFIAFSWDEIDDALFLYVGDESTAPAIDAFNTTWTNTLPSTVTENSIMASRGVDSIDGRIDEFRYWNTERTLSQIQSDYDTVLTGAESGLQNYYQFENSLSDMAGSTDLVLAGGGSLTYETDTPSAITDGYQMDLEVQFTNTFDFMETNTLSIFTGTTSSENIAVSYWGGSSWTQLVSDLTPLSWNNFTVPLSGTTFTLQFSQGYSDTDSSRASSQVDVILLTYEGEGFYDDYIDQTSDIDSTPDKGSQSQFSNLQTKDGIYNNYAETIGGGNTTVLSESFEASHSFSLAGSWAIESDQAWDGTSSADYDGDGSSGSITAPAVDASNADAIYLDFYWYDSGLLDGELELRLHNGSWNTIADLNTIEAGDGWHHYSARITDSGYFVNNLLIRWTAINVEVGKLAAIDLINVDVERFELVKEIQFTNVLQGIPKTTLSIFANDTDAEDFIVEIWDGSTWIEGFSDLTPNDWNNITVTEYITSDLFTIRFRDGSSNSDVSQDSWQIDAVILNYDSKTTHYELDWEHQTTSVDTSKEFYELSIYGYSSDGTENFNVQLWNQTSSSWLDVFAEKIDSTPGWHNYTIPSGGVIGPTITWRYTGTVDGDENLYDLTQNTLYVDYSGIASWEEIPEVTSNPADIADYEEGNSPYSLSWTATDSNAVSYTIYLDESIDTSGSWTSDVAINRNIDGLLKGTHNYTIEFTDISGNTVIDEVEVIVIDVTNPTFSITPSDLAYEAGETNNWLNWTASDNYHDYYRIFKNNSLQTVDPSWISGSSIDYDVDGLELGVHNFTLVVFDESNNSKVDTVIVLVSDTINPTIVSPVPMDAIYEAGTAGNVITWNTTDVLPDNFFIYRNGTQVDTGSWSSGSEYDFVFTSTLTPKVYNFTIILFDTSGNSVVSTVYITVVDTAKPVIVPPADIQFDQGTTGNQVEWLSTDIYVGTYIIYRNGTQVDTNTWSSGVNIIYDLDNEDVGSHEFEIFIFDTNGNNASDSVIVIVNDTTAPSVTDALDIPDYVEGTPGYTITWNTIDSDPDTLTIYRDQVILFSAPWINDSDSIINIDGLSKGTYNYTIIVYDTSGNYATDTAIVTVNDETDPVLNTPTDFKYPEGSTGNVIEWIGTDLHNGTFAIYRNNSVLVASGNWVSSGTISINIDGLSENMYNFTIYIFDTSSNSASDVVWVEVTAEPVFSDVPNDLFYVVGDTGNTLNWTMIDSNPDTYILYRDGSPINRSIDSTQTIWKNGIPISFFGDDIDGLPIGVYTYRLEINDTDFNTAYDEVIVTISDMPLFAAPFQGNITDYIEGSTSNTLTWNSTDLDPDTYTVYMDSSVFRTYDGLSWDNASTIVVNIDGLEKGTYNFTIIIYDNPGNYITNTTWVTVLDQQVPSWDKQASDIDSPDYKEGFDTPTLTWNATDKHPDYYIIYRSTTITNITMPGWTGSWANSSDITLNIGGLKKGEYNFTIFIFDTTGNYIMHRAFVNVTDLTAPIFDFPPPDDIPDYVEDVDTGTITWDVTDLYEDSYIIYHNNVSVFGDTWTNGSSITWDINNLKKGDHNFTIIVFDDSGNYAIDTVWVTVLDETKPTFGVPQADINDYEEGIDTPTLSWDLTDRYEDTYTITENGVPIPGHINQVWSNSSTIDLDISGLSKGEYTYIITVYDQSGNFATDTVEVTVLDEKDPEFDSTPSDDSNYVEGVTDYNLIWNATDLYEDNYTLYINDVPTIIAQPWTNASVISINIEGLAKGTYNYSIIVYDQSGLYITHFVEITVNDEAPPSINSPTDITFAADNPGPTVLWLPIDLYEFNYTIYQDNISIVVNQLWTNASGISLDLDALSLLKGDYNFTVYVEDKSGNTVSNTVWIYVLDDTNPIIYDPPSDLQYTEGDTGYSISWNVSDNYRHKYVIYNGSDIIDSGSWVPGNISISVDTLPLGEYVFSLRVNDTSGNFAIDSVTVTVVEFNAPLISQPGDIIYSGGDTGYEINWTLNDSYPDTYQVRRNGLLVDFGSWLDGEKISVNIDGLIRGDFTFIITVYDTSGNVDTDEVLVTVTDTTDPEIFDQQGNYEIQSGDLGQVINWTPTDDYPDFYRIYHNDESDSQGVDKLVFERGWNNNVTDIYPIDDLLIDYLGNHTFTIIVFDQSGNNITITIHVTVFDNINPVFTSEQTNISYAEGSSAPFLTWVGYDQSIDDVNKKTYVIYENITTIVKSGTWDPGESITIIPNLSKGIYDYTIVISDAAGNINSSSLIITVTDETAPIFVSEPGNDTYDEGSTGHSISWTMTDVYQSFDRSDTYTIYKNNTLISANGTTWLSNAPIVISTDDLLTGIYNYTIVVFDLSGNSNSSTVFITVIDVTNPELILEADLTEFVEGTTGNELVWNVIDVHPGNYNLTRDGDNIAYAVWISGQDLAINIDDLEAGTYSFTIIFEDQSTNKINQTIEVVVIDIASPQITGITTPDDNTVNIHETNYIEWAVNDLHPSTYFVKIGDVVIERGEWDNTGPIIIEIDSAVTKFSYNYTIEIQDESGNTVTDWVIIRVKDPEITDTVRPELEITRFVYEGDIEDINGTWVDIDGNPITNATITIRLFDSLEEMRKITTTTDENGFYVILLDYGSNNTVSILPGNYTWKIEFSKNSFQTWDDIELDATVLLHNYSLRVDIPAELIQGEEYPIVAIVVYDNFETITNGSLSLNAISSKNGKPVSDVEVTFLILVIEKENGRESLITKTVFTNPAGVAIIVLSASETSNLDYILSINVKIEKSTTAKFVSEEFDQKLPEILEGDPSVLEDVITFITSNLALIPIIALLIGVSVFTYGVYNRRKRDKIREINNSVKSANVELLAIQSIQSIIMQTASKLTIYEEQMAEGELNSTLISGMVTAFSSFLGEIGKNELFGFEMMEREGVSITLHKGEVSNIIIISNEKLPLIVLSQIRDAQILIESEFKTNFTNTTRGVTKLTRDKIHPLFHKASFKIDLQDQLVFNESNIRKLLKQKSLSRALKTNISLLYEFPKSDYFKDKQYKLNDLIRFFQSQGITERVSSRTIILAYQFDVIDSERNQ